MIKIDINLDELNLRIDAAMAGLIDKATIHDVAAKAVRALWDKHLRENYVPKDKFEDFWADVANSLESKASAESGEVSVEQLGTRLRYYGGTVTPGKGISSYTQKLTRALALPTFSVPVVEGRFVRPARAGPLAFVRAMNGGDVIGYLFQGEVRGTISRGRNKGKPRVVETGPLMYTLKLRHVTRPDKDIIPADEVLSAAAKQAVLDYLGTE